MSPDNRAIYNANWQRWLDMKVHGPASRWLRFLIRSQLRHISHPETIRSILDVGCGEGTVTYLLAKWFPNAKTEGIDFSEMGIQCAESRYSLQNLHFSVDLFSDALTSNYDLVTAFEVLEHVEDWRTLLGRITDSAQQFVLLSYPTGQMRPFEKDVGHYRNFKRGEVETFLLNHGFYTCLAWYAGFPFYSPIYRDMCNTLHSISRDFGAGSYNAWKKMLTHIFYILFRFLSTKRTLGDQFCGLFISHDYSRY